MTQTEHLQRIRTRCEELIGAYLFEHEPDARVAGWRATITAIETLLAMQFADRLMNTRTSHVESGIAAILAAWPEELL